MREQSFIGGDGLELAADVRGPEDAPPVILLHGGGQTRSAWRATSAALAGHGLKVISVDQRGHGESQWSPQGDYLLDRFADDIRAVIATLSLPPVVVGASLGGLATILAAGEAPEARIAALVLVDIVPRFERSGGEHVVGFMRGTEQGFDTLDAAAEAIAAYLPHRRRQASPEGLMRNLKQGPDGRWYWRWDPAFVRPVEGWDPERVSARLAAAARRISAPTLMVRGTKSEVVSEEAMREFRQLMPDAEIAEVADARHMVAGDDNDAFQSATLDFVLRNAARG